jgi:hypothetical protein
LFKNPTHHFHYLDHLPPPKKKENKKQQKKNSNLFFWRLGPSLNLFSYIIEEKRSSQHLVGSWNSHTHPPTKGFV